MDLENKSNEIAEKEFQKELQNVLKLNAEAILEKKSSPIG